MRSYKLYSPSPGEGLETPNEPFTVAASEGLPPSPPEPFYAMVISPHPDDSEFGAAGTVAKWSREARQVVYVVCTNGDKGTRDLTLEPHDLARIREEEQLQAARMLGVREVVFLGYADQSLEDTPDFRKLLVRLIRTYRPTVVVTADPYRRYLWHRDHRITGTVVLDAIFPFARDHLAYPDLLEEGLQPHKVDEALLWASEDPDFCIDITKTFEVKLAALRCHKSQVGNLDTEFHGYQMQQWLEDRHRQMASNKGFEFGEAFHRVEYLW